MAYDFETVAWEDFDGDRHEGKPSDVGEVWGQLVHAYDTETGESEYFWAWVLEPYDNWVDWLWYIEGLLDMYGLSFAGY